MSFPSISPSQRFSETELSILDFWKKNDVFQKSVDFRPAENEYVFFDGPPFATGTPHYGHILAGAIKDAIPRYYTMKGFRVNRKWGWDCHGVPVEFDVEKRFNIGGKPGIEKMGVANFNETCRSIVLEYTDAWEKTVERMGRFVDFKNDYKTMDPDFMESVWSVFKALWDKNLIYEGEKVVAYSPKLGSPLSNFEANLNYKQIKDKTLFVKFKITSPSLRGNEGESQLNDTYFLAWTTTPWTLPSNLALCVNPKLEYVKIEKDNEYYIVAESLVEKLFGENVEIAEKISGKNLVGKKYTPLFSYFSDHQNAFQILGDEFVSDSDGTGIVHLAPNFGEDDARVCQANGISFLEQPIDENGYFTEKTPELAGKYFRPDETVEGSKANNANDEVIKMLKNQGKIFKQDQYDHDYPFCWRTECALMYRGIKTWFVDIQKIKSQMLEQNQEINWNPDHLKDGRFGKMLENAPDWAISRNRYWGAPIPVWRCSTCGHIEVISTREELKEKTGKEVDDLHKHFVDDLTWDCEKCAEKMHRIPEVLDCWFESGAMPYASRGIHFQKNKNDETQIFFVRHGESTKNSPVQIESHTVESAAKYPLTEKGKQDAKNEAEKYENQFDVIITSPFLRAKQTAEIFLSTNPQAMLLEDERLQDFNMAARFDDLPVEDSVQFILDHPEIVHTPQEDGESIQNVLERVLECIADYSSKYPEKKILFVTHGTPIEQLKLYENNKPLAFQLQCFPHTLVTPIILPKEEKSMQADFIAEGLDQTRGWFYTLHVLGCALTGKNIFKNVITNGIVLAEDGQKMSKSKKNYPDPSLIFDKYGADAMRYYMLSSPVVRAENFRFAEKGVEEVLKTILIPLQNVYAFFSMYANIDGWESPFDKGDLGDYKNEKNFPLTPLKEGGDLQPKTDLDKWILGEYEKMRSEFTEKFEQYKLDEALRGIPEFIDSLTNWYIRRSRDRFWESGMREEKKSGYETLYFVLKNLAKILAPIMPFYSEFLWKNLTDPLESEVEVNSVHLQNLAESAEQFLDENLSEKTKLLREIITLSASIRARKKLKRRQPLAKISFAISGKINFSEEDIFLLQEEVNVKTIEMLEKIDGLAKQMVKADARIIGKRFGKKTQEIINAGKAGSFTILENGKIQILGEILESTEYEMAFECAEGIEGEGNQSAVVLLDTEISEELFLEGLAREIIRTLQEGRKKAQFNISNRISVQWFSESENVKKAYQQFSEMIDSQTLTTHKTFGKTAEGINAEETEIDEHSFFFLLSLA